MIKLEVNHSDHIKAQALLTEQSQTQQLKMGCLESKIESKFQDLQTGRSSIISSHENSKGQTELDVSLIKNRQMDVVERINERGKKLKRSVEELIDEYKNEAEKMMSNHGHDIEKQRKIVQHLRRLQAQKRERQILMKRELEKLNENEQLKDSSISKEQKAKKRAAIEARLRDIEDCHNKRLADEANFAIFYEQYQRKKPRFKKMQESFELKEEKEREDSTRATLEMIREAHRSIDLKQIASFKSDYESRRYQLERERLQNKIMVRKAEEEAAKKLDELYRGHYYQGVKKQVNYDPKKTELKNKCDRIKQYSNSIREQHRTLSVQQAVEEQEESEQEPESLNRRKVVKDRYLKGCYQGKKIVHETIPMTDQEQLLEGLKNLQYLKRLPKKAKVLPVEEKIPIQKKPRVFSVERRQNSIYRKERERDYLLADSGALKTIVVKMRLESQKLRSEEVLLRHRRYDTARQKQAQTQELSSKMVNCIQKRLNVLREL